MGGVFVRPVLTKDSLRTIREHKYVPGTYTWLDNALNPFWDRSVELMPIWLAPNAITAIGLSLMAATVPMAALYLFWHKAATASATTAEAVVPVGHTIPGYMHVIIAVVLFLYQTLDAIDGKQARRTRSSTPLGQLFDHGCDAVATAILIYHLTTALGLAQSVHGDLIMVAGLTTFYAAQWQEMQTGILQTNVGQIGVSEAQFGAMGIHLAVAALEPALLYARVPFGVIAVGGHTLTLFRTANQAGAVALLLVVLFALGHMIVTGARTSRVGAQAALRALIPEAMLVVSTLACVLGGRLGWSPLGAAAPGTVLLIYVLSQLQLTTKTIVFGMAHQHYSALQAAALSMPLLLLLDLLEPGLAEAAAPLVLLLSAGGYASLVASFVHQISGALEVRVFRIKPLQKEGSTAAPGPAATSAAAGSFAAAAAVAHPPPALRTPGGKKSKRT